MQLTKERKTAYAFLMINALIWGAGLPIVKFAFNDGLTPFRFLLYRFVIASIVATPILLTTAKEVKNIRKTSIKIILLELLGLTLSLTLLYYGLSKTTSVEAGLLSSTGPLFITLGGIMFLREHEDRNEAIGLGIALIGTLLIASVPLFYSSEKFEFSLFGNTIIVLQNIVAATYFILIKKHYDDIPSFFASSLSYYVGVVSFFIITLIEAGSLSQLTAEVQTDLGNSSTILASVYMAVCGSIIALTFYMKAQRKIEVSEASLFGYLQPVIYIPLGVLWLNENITTLQIIGLAIVITGVYVASRRIQKKLA